ncbi:MAG: hypothetical protein JO354_04780 [Verrucomicrobia bacterium]|nr:hypothetical protein [Verrucomicrobiota bacterium]
MDRDEDPQLWDLLGHSAVPRPSPLFARNVLRAVRNEPSRASTIASWFQVRWLVPGFSAVAAIVVALFTLHTLRHHPQAAPVQQIAMARQSATPWGQQIVSANITDPDLATDLEVLAGPDDDSDDTASL